ncbi:MAG: F0F1 ATP synthase subunit A [Acutalibacteraceae bacterium]
MIDYIIIAVGAFLCVLGVLLFVKAKKKLLQTDPSDAALVKKTKKNKKLSLILAVVGGYAFSVKLITVLFGASKKELEVSIMADRTELFGLSVSNSVIYTWIIIAVVLVVGLILRFTVIRNMKESPTGIQNLLEICVEAIDKYTSNQVPCGAGKSLSAYLLSLAVFMVGCAVVELFGYRSPTSDITVTFAMALITFFLINYYGIRKKGVGGRIKTIAKPVPAIFPIKVISDIAVPVSLACRLFGNMLGGMVVMDLLYVAMKNWAIGVPSVLGLYFNVFHPLIQAFIFITLTLAFINESVED